MDADLPCPDAPLPDDVPALQALVRLLLAEVARLRADNARLSAENAELKGKLDCALKHRFGRRSERRPRRREPAGDDEPGKRRDDHGRSPLPEHLPRREVVHDLSDEEKRCGCCGRARVCIGVQTAEQLDLGPARFFVVRTTRKSYACPRCDPVSVPAEQRLRTAGPAQVGPIAKGLCGPGLLAHAVTAKFADHTPLHRLAGQLSRSGVSVARSAPGDWLRQAADLMRPLYRLMRRRLLLSRALHGDDTAVKLRVAGAGRTRKAHLWVAIGDANYDGTYRGLYDVARRPDLAKDLKLSEKQLEALAGMRKALDASRRGSSKSRVEDGLWEEHVEYVRADDKKVEALLTPAQRAKLKELVGPELKGRVNPPGR